MKLCRPVWRYQFKPGSSTVTFALNLPGRGFSLEETPYKGSYATSTKPISPKLVQRVPNIREQYIGIQIEILSLCYCAEFSNFALSGPSMRQNIK